MGKATYYAVYEYPENAPKRLVFTFETEEAAHDVVEFIFRHNIVDTKVAVEPHEVTT